MEPITCPETSICPVFKELTL